MIITFKVAKNDKDGNVFIKDEKIEGVVKINSSKAGLSYWKEPECKNFFYLSFSTCADVRIYDENQYANTREREIV